MSKIQSDTEHLILNADGSGKEVRFQNNGTQNVVIDSSGNVGIGTSSPGEKLHINGNIKATPSADNYGIDIQGNHSTNFVGARIYNTASGAGSAARLNWSTGTANSYVLQFLYDNSGSPYFWESCGSSVTQKYVDYDQQIHRTTGGGTEILRWNSSGLSFDGGSNYLDDYEEGTFTPYFSGASSNPTVTYAQQTGSYTKIGNQVFVEIRIVATGSGGSGYLYINGLPFTVISNSNMGGCFTIGFSYNWSVDPEVFAVFGGDTRITIYSNDSTNTNATTSALNSGSNLYINISGHYTVS